MSNNSPEQTHKHNDDTNALEIWRRAFESEDLGDLKAPEPVPPSPEDAAEALEIAGYSDLTWGRPSCAVMNCELAARAYRARGREEDAEIAVQAASRMLQSCFPPFRHVSELMSEVRLWSQARLRQLYGKVTETSEDSAALSLRAQEEMRLHWVLRLRMTTSQLPNSPLALLPRLLRLTSSDLIWLAVLLSLDGDPQFENMRRNLVNNDSYYTVDFMTRLLATNDQERNDLLARLDRRFPMRNRCLVAVNRPAARPGTNLIHHFIELDESVKAFVGGRDIWPDEAAAIARLHLPKTQPGEAYFEGKLAKLDRAMAWPEDPDGGRFIALCGIMRDTNLTLARVWANANQRPLVEVHADRMFDRPNELMSCLSVVVREAMLRRAIVFIDGGRRWDNVRDGGALLESIVELTESSGLPILFDAPIGGEALITDTVSPLFMVRTLPPDLDEQVVIWQEATEHALDTRFSDNIVRQQICSSALSIEDIHRAVRLVADNAYLAGENDKLAEVTPEELRAAATSKLNRGMYSLAEKLETTLTWNDVILSEETIEPLMEIVTYARYQREVFEEWGFGNSMPYGRGNSSLFFGPPGTGKTMIAGIIARELGMDLFRIETSRVVSKYIGETEKNLGRIFDEAERGHAILLFDEADSLFAKRTEVNTSHDRYANLEVGYLLQRIEAFSGITFLTTNMRDNIDEAFARRIRFKIEFPKPDEDDRNRMWRLMIPPSAEKTSDIDFEHLSKAFDFTGANIRCAVLRAAFRAVESKAAIGNCELESAGIAVAKELGMLVRVVDGRVLVPGTESVATEYFPYVDPKAPRGGAAGRTLSQRALQQIHQ